MRCVFCYAAEQTNNNARCKTYRHKARHYYRQCFADLEPFGDRIYLTQPIAILLPVV